MIPFINIHTHKPDNDAIFILNAPSSGILTDTEYSSFGIHPWEIDKIDIETQVNLLNKFCLEKKLVAIGEIGLDRAIKTSPEIQKDVFTHQLEIAKQWELPVILHCVRAWNDILSIRKAGKYDNSWIFHGYNGNIQNAEQIIQSGCFISFGKSLVFSNKLQDLIVQLPMDYIFFETDDSEFEIEEIYLKAANLYHICMDDLKAIIWNNFRKVFDINNV